MDLETQILSKLLPVFRKVRAEDARRIRLALEVLDFATLKELGHKIKGSASSFGFQEMSALGGELEESASKSEPERTRSAAMRLLESLKRELG